jgi:hypothetical protein
MVVNVVENLKRFNSKERFFLIAHALGNPTFQLSWAIVDQLKEVLKNPDIDFSDQRFAGMDYHLDWIHASLHYDSTDKCFPRYACDEKGNKPQPGETTEQRCVEGTQDDIDLLVVFGDKTNATRIHLAMIEAKGVTKWNKKQLQSKAERLAAIFEPPLSGVQPYFVIASPGENPRIELSLPDFKPSLGSPVPWMRLPMASPLLKVTRCNKEKKPGKDERYWMVEER